MRTPLWGRNDATTPNRTSDHDGEIGYITLPSVASNLGLSSNSLTGTSTLTLTATGGGVTHTAMVTLVVQ